MIRALLIALAPACTALEVGVQPIPIGAFAGGAIDFHEHARLTTGIALTDLRTGGVGDHRLGPFVDLSAVAPPLRLAVRYQPSVGVTYDGLEPPDGGVSLVLALFADL